MKTFIFGFIWIMCLSPLTIFILLGSMTNQYNPSLYEVFMVLWGTFMYWRYVWLKVCNIFNKETLEFCNMVNWRQ